MIAQRINIPEGVRQRRSVIGKSVLVLFVLVLLLVQITGPTAALAPAAQPGVTDEKANELGQLPEQSSTTDDRLTDNQGENDHNVAASGGLGEAALLLAAYTRFNDVSPLEHDVRSDIIEIVGALPGLYLAQLVTKVGKPSSTVRYHTRVLERENRLQSAKLWGNHRFYPPTMDEEAFAYHAMRRDTASSRVYDVVNEHEPITVGVVADLIDRAPSTVSHHLSRLEAAGLIERIRNGESVHVRTVLAESAIETS